MPYKCNLCGKMYEETSPELRDVMLRGSCICGKRFLMYIRKDQQTRPVKMEPTPEDKIMEPSPYLPQKTPVAKPVAEPPKVEKGPLDWLEKSFVKVTKSEEPMYLSIETIKILEDGKYQIDVSSLMGGKPLIVEDEHGVYYIDVPHAMKKKGKDEGGSVWP
ncbi:MAG: Zn-ribbon containing protein [Candidatus Altiarchaeota archaeon]